MSTIQIPYEIDERLTIVAQESGISKDFCIREALLDYIENFEDIRDVQQVLEDIRLGKESTVSFEEVRNEIGLDISSINKEII